MGDFIDQIDTIQVYYASAWEWTVYGYVDKKVVACRKFVSIDTHAIDQINQLVDYLVNNHAWNKVMNDSYLLVSKYDLRNDLRGI